MLLRSRSSNIPCSLAVSGYKLHVSAGCACRLSVPNAMAEGGAPAERNISIRQQSSLTGVNLTCSYNAYVHIEGGFALFCTLHQAAY